MLFRFHNSNVFTEIYAQEQHIQICIFQEHASIACMHMTYQQNEDNRGEGFAIVYPYDEDHIIFFLITN